MAKSAIEVVIGIKKLFGSSPLLKKYKPARIVVKNNVMTRSRASVIVIKNIFMAGTTKIGNDGMPRAKTANDAAISAMSRAISIICANNFFNSPFTHKFPRAFPSAISKLAINRLKDEHICKVVDLLPKTPNELKLVLQGYGLSLTNEASNKIFTLSFIIVCGTFECGPYSLT